jgi:hypothetical protein
MFWLASAAERAMNILDTFSAAEAGFANPHLLALMALASRTAMEFSMSLVHTPPPRPSREDVEQAPELLDDEVPLRLKAATTRGMFGSQRMVRAGPHIAWADYLIDPERSLPPLTFNSRPLSCAIALKYPDALTLTHATTGAFLWGDLLGPGPSHATRCKNLLGQFMRLTRYRREQV